MKRIKVKTPAKINLTLEVLNKREDGFHNIQSIMQAISLYDYLSFEIQENEGIEIKLDGNSKNIPYDSSNLVHKAAVKFFEKAGISDIKLDIYIEKNIPIAAGLAGGSTNAAGTFYALNKLFNNVLSLSEIDELCASLGSDINFCLKGGCCLCSSRGEKIENLPTYIQKVSLIKPKNLGISAKEAYMNFSKLSNKSNPNNTIKLKNLLLTNSFDKSLLYNSLEKALFPSYEELTKIKENVKGSLMSGSGATFFVLDENINTMLDKSRYEIFENLTTIDTGVKEV
ncbi:4-(cytidine 5'-diphospho)-2-C-methyl-D-erythritol kinase [bacterium]|nr:4-(cytidine 5'-diphospho)-2-C-methyl-D-erythritol kinase [bacterium]